MNLKQLPYIVEIAGAGNLSAAAKRLGISQPALSKYLFTLEREIGLELFARSSKKLTPTQAGLVYLDAARRILDVLGQTTRAIRQSQGYQSEKLYIGGTPHRGVMMIAKIYHPFRRMFPDTELVPVEGYARQIREDVRQGRTNLAMTTLIGEDSDERDLDFLPLFDEELVLGVPAFQRIARQAVQAGEEFALRDISDFKDTPFVVMPPTTSIGAVCKRLFSDAGLSPTVVYTSNNIVMVNQMIRTGVGAGLIPRFYAVPSDEVVYFRLRQPSHFTSCVAMARGRPLSREERYVIYLKLKDEVNDPHHHFHWSDTLTAIVDEFENVSPLPSPLARS